MPDDTPAYAMAVAERITGLTRRRIRYYERMGLLEPARSAGNRRLYSQTDLGRLTDIKRLLDEGMALRALVSLAASGEWSPDVGAGSSSASADAAMRRPACIPGPGPSPTGPPRAGGAHEVARFAQYEDARARLLGRGPAGNLDRLYPGDAGRLARPGPAPAAPSVPRKTEPAAPGGSKHPQGRREG